MAHDVVADPETDPTATYAVDPALVRRLARRVVAAPAGRAPRQPHAADRRAARRRCRCRPARTSRSRSTPARAAQRGLVAHADGAARADLPALPRPRPRATGASCSTLVQLESGKTRRQAFEEVADVALVARHYARSAAAYLRPRRRAGLFPVLTQSTVHHHAARGRRHRQPVELPAVARDHRRHPGADGGQRRRAAAGPAGLAHRAAGRAAAHRGRAAGVGAPGRARRRAHGGAGGRRPQRLRLLHRLDRRPGAASPRRSRDAWSATRSSSAARTRCTSPTTPTSTRRSRGRCGPASPRRASCASRSSGCCVHGAVADEFTRRFVAAVGEMTARAPSWPTAPTWGRWCPRPSSTAVTRPRRGCPGQGRRACSRVVGRAPTSAPTSTSPPSSRASRPRWSCATTRPSARSWRSTGSHSDEEAIRFANDTDYGLNAASGPATSRAAAGSRPPSRPARSTSTRGMPPRGAASRRRWVA